MALSQAELDYIGMVIGQVQNMYPQLAWAIKVPELAPIITQAAREQWDEGRIAGALQGTDWWKSRNDAAREWERLVNTDPKTAEGRKTEYRTRITDWASRNGVKLTQAQIDEVTNWATALQFDEQQIAAYIIDHFKPGTAAPVGDQLKSLAAQYAVPMSEATLNKWSNDLLTGRVDEQTFRSYLVEQAKSLFPGLTNALDRGITVDQYVAPYREVAVQELGVNPAEIDWRDPKWNAAIHRVDPKTGQATAMSLSDWTKELRSNSVYGFDQTLRAREQASALGQALLERLGRAA